MKVVHLQHLCFINLDYFTLKIQLSKELKLRKKILYIEVYKDHSKFLHFPKALGDFPFL